MTHPWPWVDSLSRVQVIALATDEWWASALTGELDVTLSTLADMRTGWQWRALRWVLDTCFPGHCARARLHDRQRANAMIRYLNETPAEGSK